MAHHEHGVDHISCVVITVSSSRGPEEDQSGERIVSMLEDAGHTVSRKELVPDDRDSIATALDQALKGPERMIVVTGGTGISSRDQTVEVVEPRLDGRLPGFGELFRFLSFREIGARALLSAALGGVAGGSLIFALPGSKSAVELGMRELIIPVAGHAIYELDKERT